MMVLFLLVSRVVPPSFFDVRRDIKSFHADNAYFAISRFFMTMHVQYIQHAIIL